MVGEDALNGKPEKIDGWHTFLVDGQKRIVAAGLVIMIYAPGQQMPVWHGNDTGEGEDVAEGYKVEVFNVSIHFSK